MSSVPRRPGSPSSPERPTSAGGTPWVPPGIRPLTAPNPHTTPLTGTRRNRAVERTHIFVDQKDLSPRDPSNYFWLYAAYEYRMQTTLEEAKATCFRMIDRLVERARSAYHDAPPLVYSKAAGAGDALASAAHSNNRLTSLSVASTEPPFSLSATASNGPSGGEPKCHLIMDLISTKKHIGAVPEVGLPYQLGHAIYRYVDATYGHLVATTFIGLTDNTARRVGRDVYYTKSDDLSRTHYGFRTVDREHLFIIFPPSDEPPNGEPSARDGRKDGPREPATRSGRSAKFMREADEGDV